MKRWLGLGLGMLGCAGAAPPPTPSRALATRAAAPVFKTGLVFGTADPYTLLGFDPQAQWLAMCQARHDTNGDGITRVGFFHHGEKSGDQMKTYFILGGGEGEAVDAFLGSSASGGWVALRRGEALDLLDTRTGKKRDLASLRLDREPDPSAAGGVRNVRFAPEKERVLLVESAEAGRAGVVVMELATGGTQRLDLGPGRVWQAGFSNDGSWVLAAVVTKDLTGNGKLDLPTIATNRDDDACGQPLSYSTFGLREAHDEITQVAVPVAGGKWRPVKKEQGTLAGDLVWRRPDGALVRESPAGKQQVLASPACRAALLDYYSLENERWLVACAKPEQEAPAAVKPGPDEEPEPRLQATEIWAFGRGLPAQGKHTGVSLKYGAEGGNFGTKRYSSLYTARGVVYYDLAKLEAVPVPAGFEPCAGTDGHYLLEAGARGGWGEDSEQPAPTVAPGIYEWSPGGAPKLVTTETSCNRLDERYTLLGSLVFDRNVRQLVGTIAPLCEKGDCRKLSYAPFSPAQHFLWRRQEALTVGATTLEERLRESLAASGAKSYAERGPLRFESWSSLATAAPVAKPRPQANGPPEFMREPPVSCEPLVAEVTARPSPLPAWTEVRPVGGSLATFPSQYGTHDEQPTFEQLGRQLCQARELAFVLEGIEQVAARAAALPQGDDRESLSQRHSAEHSPAFGLLEMLARSCAPADVCRLGVAIADSRFERVKAEVAAPLLLACDAVTVGARFSQLGASPLLQLEWLVGGEGRRAGSAGQMQAQLDAILASKERYDMEHAVGMLAADERPEVTALLLATRARLVKAPAPIKSLGPSESAPAPFGVDAFDVALSTTRTPRLQKLYRDVCRRLTTAGGDDWSVKHGCRATEPGEKPATVQYRFLEGRHYEAAVEKVPGGLPTLKLGRGDIWNVLYQAAIELSHLPGSPLAGALVDTPMRRRQGKLAASFRLWLGGQLYELDAPGLTAVSLAWAQKSAALPQSDALVIRGFLAWLNGIARARGSSERFFYARRSIENHLIMATQPQACALSSSSPLKLSQEPITSEPWR